MAAVTNLSDFSNCIRNLYHLRFLPLGERNYEERQFLEAGVRQRRNALRLILNCVFKLNILSFPSGTKSLFVDDLINKMQQISPDEAFWLEQSGKDWYPPALHVKNTFKKIFRIFLEWNFSFISNGISTEDETTVHYILYN